MENIFYGSFTSKKHNYLISGTFKARELTEWIPGDVIGNQSTKLPPFRLHYSKVTINPDDLDEEFWLPTLIIINKSLSRSKFPVDEFFTAIEHGDLMIDGIKDINSFSCIELYLKNCDNLEIIDNWREMNGIEFTVQSLCIIERITFDHRIF